MNHDEHMEELLGRIQLVTTPTLDQRILAAATAAMENRGNSGPTPNVITLPVAKRRGRWLWSRALLRVAAVAAIAVGFIVTIHLSREGQQALPVARKPLEGEASVASMVPPRQQSSDDEVLTFDAPGHLLFACWGDGTVGVWNYITGDLLSSFRPGDFNPLDSNRPAWTCFSVSPTGVVAIVTEGEGATEEERFGGKVSFYDTGGTLLKECTVPDMVGMVGLGFSQDGSKFFCDHYLQETVLGLDVASGQILWRLPTEAVGYSKIKVSPDGGSFAHFQQNKITVRNILGHALWEKTPEDFLQCTRAQPRGWVATLYDEDKHELSAIFLADGHALWTKGDTDWDGLRAVSADGSRQVFFRQGEDGAPGVCEIAGLPATGSVAVPAITSSHDMVFTNGGHLLLCLPTLEKTGENQQGHSETYARPSRMLKVIDATTGQLRNQFELKKPAATGPGR